MRTIRISLGLLPAPRSFHDDFPGSGGTGRQTFEGWVWGGTGRQTFEEWLGARTVTAALAAARRR